MSKIYEALEYARNKRMIPEKPIEVPLPKTYRTPESDIGVDNEMLSLYQNISALLPDVTHPVVMFIGSHSTRNIYCARQLARLSLFMEALGKRSPPHRPDLESGSEYFNGFSILPPAAQPGRYDRSLMHDWRKILPS